MLGIRIKTKWLELGKTTFNFRLLNPIFNKTGLSKAFSFPVRIDATPANNVLLSHTNRLDTATDTVKINAGIYLNGMPFLYGYLTINNRTGASYDCTFTDYNTDFLQELRRTKIRDILNEVIDVVSTSATYELQLQNVPTRLPNGAKIGLKINNQVYFYQVSSTTGEHKDTALLNLSSIINADYTGSANAFSTPGTLLLTQNSTSDTFAVVVENYQFHHEYEWNLINSNAQHVIHQNEWGTYLNSNLATPIDSLKVGFPQVHNSSLYEANHVFYQTINDYNHTGYRLNDTAHDAGQWLRTLAPYVSLRYLIEEIFNSLGNFDLSGDFLDDLSTLLIYHSQTLDFQVVGDTSSEYYNIFKRSFNLKNYIPKLSAENLLALLKETFGVVFLESGNTYYIQSIENIIKQKAIDCTDKLTPAYKYGTPAFEGVAISMVEDDKDESPVYPDYTLGDGKNPYELIATVYNSAQVSQKKDTDVPLKLMKYIPASVEATNYTTPNTTYLNNKTYFDLLHKGKELMITMRLTTSDLIRLSTFQNPVGMFRHPAGFVKGVIKSIAFKANQNGISESTVQLLCW